MQEADAQGIPSEKPYQISETKASLPSASKIDEVALIDLLADIVIRLACKPGDEQQESA